MSAEATTATTDVVLTDGTRWSGDVVASTTDAIEWGTHEIEYHLRVFESGAGFVEVAAPHDPPPSAREIVADLRAGSDLQRHIGAVLAREWGLDTSWFREVRA